MVSTMEQRSVRFSTKKPVEHESTDLGDWEHDELKNILRLSLPRFINESCYDRFDVHTAASLGISGKDVPELVPGWELNINAENAHKWTPLMYAAYLGHHKLCEEILGKITNVDCLNEVGQSALMLAASCGSVDTVKILLKHRADINRQDCRGWSSLHYSTHYNQSAITEMLLEYGADPNLQDNEGMTPVLIACEVGSDATVSTLMKYKGDPNHKNLRGENGEILAAEFPKVLKLIKNRPSLESILKQLGLEKYIPIFERDQITLSLFLELTEKDLTDMGITLFGPRKKLMNIIKQYKERGIVSAEPELSISGNPPTTSDDTENHDMHDRKSQVPRAESKPMPNSSGTTELPQLKNELSRAMNALGAQQKELREQFELNAHMQRFLMVVYERERKNRVGFDPKFNSDLEQMLNKLSASIGRLKNFI